MFSFMIDYDKIVYARVMVRLDGEFTNRTTRDGQKKKGNLQDAQFTGVVMVLTDAIYRRGHGIRRGAIYRRGRGLTLCRIYRRAHGHLPGVEFVIFRSGHGDMHLHFFGIIFYQFLLGNYS